ncbi:MAG: rnhB [Bacillales bacterium]|jgi:ribonuclease HII|nr:rnhB [Bacillales bacterium]
MKKVKSLTIQDVKDILSNNPDSLTLNQIENDKRSGVQKLINSYKRRIQIENALFNKFVEMKEFDMKTVNKSNLYIAGIDEVGRGPLAGPVVSAAVILKKDSILLGVDDSKKLTDEKRDILYDLIVENSEAIGIGIISPEQIDEVNIYEATKLAMVQAVNNLNIRPDHLLIDAMNLDTGIPHTSIIKGDSKSLSIAAASIIAKVTRDKIMKEFSLMYPEYLFEKNMGYGTKDHLDALNKFGVLPIHRRTFAPIKDLI